MTLAASPSPAADWERLAPMPEPSGGFACGVINGEVVIAGGTNWKDDTKQWLTRIHAYNPAANAWRETGTLDAPLAYSAMGQDAQALWFASGSSGTNTHHSIWKIDKSLSAKCALSLGDGFVLAGGVLIGSTLHVLGGTDDMARLDRLTNTFLAIDLRTGKTTRLPDYPEPGFGIGAVAAAGQGVFAFGGARWDAAAQTVTNLSSAHAYSTMAKRWEKLPPLPYVIRGITAVSLDERHILLAGGYKNDAEEFTGDALIFDTRGNTYHTTKPLPYTAMVSLVKSGEWLYCLGGEDRKKHRTDAAFRIKWKELLNR